MSFKKKSWFCLLFSCIFASLLMICFLFGQIKLALLFFVLSVLPPMLYWMHLYNKEVKRQNLQDSVKMRASYLLIWIVCYMVTLLLPLGVYIYW